MGNPSPKTHLVRLGLVAVFGVAVLYTVGSLLTPASWNYEIDNWYRLDAVVDVAALPQIHGGTDACGTCHLDTHETLLAQRHLSVECETCHAPIVDHVKNGEKFADMKSDTTSTSCLACHRALVSRPKDFPQFKSVGSMADVTEDDACIMCHDPHEPKLGGD